MAGSMNKAMLVGNLGRDPEIRSMNNGNKVCNLSIATSETWKDRNSGERREKTEWHRVTVWGDAIIDNFISKYLHKGSKVLIEGKIQTRKWQDQSGQDRYSTEIVCQGYGSNVILLDSANGNGGGGQQQGGSYQDGGYGYVQNDGSDGSAPDLDEDSEIPF